MADNEGTETKEKRTVPAMVRTARGVADHAAAVLEMQWDKERKAFKDPVTAQMALFAYVKLTAALLDEAEARFDARSTALEVRTEKLEQQIAAFEMWRMDVEKQGAEMAKGFEQMMSGDLVAKSKKVLEARDAPAELPPTSLSSPTVLDASSDVEEPSTVVPLKSEKFDKKRDAKREEKHGGAA